MEQKDVSKDAEAELVHAIEEYQKDFSSRQARPAGVA
mgnify:FL=1